MIYAVNLQFSYGTIYIEFSNPVKDEKEAEALAKQLIFDEIDEASIDEFFIN